MVGVLQNPHKITQMLRNDNITILKSNAFAPGLMIAVVEGLHGGQGMGAGDN